MKKTYRGFVIWLVIWTALPFAIPFLPTDAATAMRLICNLMTLGMAALTHMICRNECIYWYNGVSFEEAVAAGSERRQAYAKAHRRVFAILAVIMLAVSAVTHVLHWSMWIDFTAATLGTIAAAVSTIRIRL